MSNRKKLPGPGRLSGPPAAGQRRYQAPRDRPPRPAAVPGQVSAWLLAAGALGAVAVAALHGGTRLAPAEGTQGAAAQTATFTAGNAQTATLTADTVPAPPATAAAPSLFAPGTTPGPPGLTGTQSGPAPWAPLPAVPFPNVDVPPAIILPPPSVFQSIFAAVGVSGNSYPKDAVGLGFSWAAAADSQFLPQNGVSAAFGLGFGTGGTDFKVSGYNMPVSTNSGLYLTWQAAIPSTATTAPPDALMPSPLGFVPPLPPDFAMLGSDGSLPPDAIQLSKVSGVVPLATTNTGVGFNPTFSATFAYKDPSIPFGLQPQVTMNVAPFKAGAETVGDDLSAATGVVSTSESVKVGGSDSSVGLSGKLFLSYQTLATWFDAVAQGNLLNSAAQGARIDPADAIRAFPTDPRGVLDTYFPQIGIISIGQPAPGVDPIPFVDVTTGGTGGAAGSPGSVTTTDLVTGAQYTFQGVGPFTNVQGDQWYTLPGQLPSQAFANPQLGFLPEGWTPTPVPPAPTLGDRIGTWFNSFGTLPAPTFVPPAYDPLGNPIQGGASLEPQSGDTQTASASPAQQNQLAQNVAAPATAPTPVQAVQAPVQAGTGGDAFAAAPYVANPAPPVVPQPATGSWTQQASADWPSQAQPAPAVTSTVVAENTTPAGTPPGGASSDDASPDDASPGASYDIASSGDGPTMS